MPQVKPAPVEGGQAEAADTVDSLKGSAKPEGPEPEAEEEREDDALVDAAADAVDSAKGSAEPEDAEAEEEGEEHKDCALVDAAADAVGSVKDSLKPEGAGVEEEGEEHKGDALVVDVSVADQVKSEVSGNEGAEMEVDKLGNGDGHAKVDGEKGRSPEDEGGSDGDNKKDIDGGPSSTLFLHLHSTASLSSALDALMAAADRKRPAPGASSSAAAGKKRPRYSFGSIDDYEMLEVLGEGAYGVVRKARDRRTGKKVAVKCVSGASDHREIFREAGFQAACRGHRSIVEIKDVAEDAKTGDKFLVMEFVGPSLREQIWRARSEDLARVMMRNLVGAAKKMHDAGIIHRDIKPENVLVSAAGELKICDFGVATWVKPAGKPYEEGHVGTMIYSSPEQLTGSRYYGTAVDMWALGCVMAELLTGEPLFDVTTEDELLTEVFDLRDQLAEHGPSAFQGLSEAGSEVLAGLLAFHPDERLTAAEALEHRWFAEEAESPAVAGAEHPGFVPLFA